MASKFPNRVVLCAQSDSLIPPTRLVRFLHYSFILSLTFFVACSGSIRDFASAGGPSEKTDSGGTDEASQKCASNCGPNGPKGNGDGYTGILKVSSALGGVYTSGAIVTIKILFSDLVTVTGTPLLALATGGMNREAVYTLGSGSTELTFSYTVQVGDTSSDLNYASTSALTLNGGSIVGSSGAVNLTLPPITGPDSLGGTSNIQIDTTGPSSPSSFSGVPFDAEVTLGWSSGSGDTDGYVVVRRASSAVTWTPTAGVTYSVSQDLGGGQTVVHAGTGLSVNDTSLTNSTDYFYKIVAYDAVKNYSTGATTSATPSAATTAWAQQAYVKSSNPLVNGYFGHSLAASGDTVVVGEPSNNGGYIDIFKRTGTTWVQEAYLQASNAGLSDQFGYSVAISGDTVVVGTIGEASSQTTITNGTTASSDNSAVGAGAAYVFKRTGTTWAQEAYLKAPNAQIDDNFGYSVSISGDTVVVGSRREDSNQTTITNGPSASADNSASDSGAAYVFKRTGTTWVHEAYLKAPNAEADDGFGYSVAVSGDTVVVGAMFEDSNQNTITNGTTASTDNSKVMTGAAYVFKRTGATWVQEAYLKAPIVDDLDLFGEKVAIDADTIVVSAVGEDSIQNTITNGPTASTDNSAGLAGAAYVFKRTGTTWAQEAYLKAPNPEMDDRFGYSISISSDTIAVGAYWEDSNQTTVTNGTTASSNNSFPESGAAYVFKRTGTTWAHEAYLKAPNAEAEDQFGFSVAVSSDTVVVGANYEGSSQNTITNGPTASGDNSASFSGAAYIFKR